MSEVSIVVKHQKPKTENWINFQFSSKYL